MFLGPMAVFADKGVGENEELAHDGGQGKLGLFAVGAKLIVEGFQVWIAAGGGDGRHIKCPPDMGAGRP